MSGKIVELKNQIHVLVWDVIEQKKELECNNRKERSN